MIGFNLSEPLPFINTEAVKGGWYIDYPSNLLTYVLQSSDTQELTRGMWLVPTQIISNWVDDSIITNALIDAKPWIIPPAPIQVPIQQNENI